MTIELSESLQNVIEQRLALSACETAEEYILKLIRDDKQRQLDAYYEREVQKGLDSGPSMSAEEFWRSLEEQIKKHREEKRQTVEV